MKRLVRPALIAASLVFGWCATFALAGELPWPDKQGPTLDGRVPASLTQNIPLAWDEELGRNIAWAIDLEGFGHSTPVIGDGRVWITSATKDGKRQFVYSIDAASGRVIHHKLLFENEKPEILANEVNTYASPSCVLEGDAVYVHFGSYGTARLLAETAEVVWQRRDLPCRHFRGPGSSPTLCGELLVLTFDGIDQQYLAALDKHSGKTVWRTDRSTDYHDLDPKGKPIGEGDYRKAYSTAGWTDVAGTRQVVSVGSRAAFGYDAQTGREIWTLTHDDFNAAARPLFLAGLAVLNTGSNGADLVAVRLDGSTQKNIDDTHVVWKRSKGNSRLCSPTHDGQRIWMLTDNGVVYALDAQSGEELAALRLGGSFVASPIAAGEHLFCCDEEGTTSVVRLNLPPEIVSRNQLREGMRSSPALADGALYLRTYTRLYKLARVP